MQKFFCKCQMVSFFPRRTSNRSIFAIALFVNFAVALHLLIMPQVCRGLKSRYGFTGFRYCLWKRNQSEAQREYFQVNKERLQRAKTTINLWNRNFTSTLGRSEIAIVVILKQRIYPENSALDYEIQVIGALLEFWPPTAKYGLILCATDVRSFNAVSSMKNLIPIVNLSSNSNDAGNVFEQEKRDYSRCLRQGFF